MPLLVLLRNPRIAYYLLTSIEAASAEKESTAVTLGGFKGFVLVMLELRTLVCPWQGSPFLAWYITNTPSLLKWNSKKDEDCNMQTAVKTKRYIFLSKHFTCHSEAGHLCVNVTLVTFPRSERLRTICSVKADCTSLSCLRSASTYFPKFSRTLGGEDIVY